jgi:hypothetical protein
MRAVVVSGLIALTALFSTAAAAAVAVPAAAGQARAAAAPAPLDERLSVSCVTSRYCVASAWT